MISDFLVNTQYMISAFKDSKINSKNIYKKVEDLGIPFFSRGRSKIFYKKWKELQEIKNLIDKSFVITFGNNKGGVAKTTSVINIGAILSFLKFKVLMLDTDTQANLTRHFIKDFKMENSILNAIKGKVVKPVVLQEEFFKDNLQLVTNDLKLSKDYEFTQAQLQKYIDKVRGDFDFILIDTPPDYKHITPKAMGVSDYGIAILKSDMYSTDGAMNFIELMEEKNLNLIMAIVTNVNTKIIANEIALDNIKDIFNQFDIDVSDTIVSDTSKFDEISTTGKGGRYNILLNAPNHKCTEQYMRIVHKLLNDLIKQQEG